MLYEIKVNHSIVKPDGEEKDVVELFLHDCELFAQAELKGLEEFDNDCDVVGIARSKIIEIVNKETEHSFFKGKVVETIVDDNGNDKERAYYILCNAENVTKATKIFEDHLKQGLEDLRLDAVVKTKIVDII
jgi:hypothetical protein